MHGEAVAVLGDPAQGVDVAEVLDEALQGFIDATLNLVENLPTLLARIAEFIPEIVQAVVDAVPQIIQAAVQGIGPVGCMAR